MSNIKLIISREYFTRVKNKKFLLTTFLAPIAIVFFYGILVFLLTRGSDNIKKIAIVDQAGISTIQDSVKNNLHFDYTYNSLESAVTVYKDKKIDGILVLPPVDVNSEKYNMVYHSDNQLAIDESMSLERLFKKKIRNHKIKELGIDEGQLKLIDTDIRLKPETILDKEKKVSSITSMVGAAVGGVVGFGLFFIIIIYGSQVMRSVTEEKINRIVEVLISSVKPYDLMMGKVIGVGLVGLTQIVIWLILISVLSAIAFSVFGISSMDTLPLDATQNLPAELQEVQQTKLDEVMPYIKEFASLNWIVILPLYIFYFLIGYFTYAALFAAIGSAMGDDIQDAQALTMIATLPLVIASYIGFSAVTSPDSSLSVWASILPFTAPVVMPVRLPLDPPFWQIATSMIVSILSVLFLIWFAARIYRVGILMYGKKASIKEFFKWTMYKG